MGRFLFVIEIDLRENVDRETKPSRVCYRELLSAVCETANRACDSAAARSIMRLKTMTLTTQLTHMIPIIKIALTPSLLFVGRCSWNIDWIGITSR